jgi:hypothetical protein
MLFPGLIADCLRAGRPVRFRARGASMHPTIRSGDTLWVAPVDPEGVRIGDVVVCVAFPGRLLAHRVVAIARKADSDAPAAAAAFQTKGDASPQPDAPVTAGAVLGKVVAVERRGRRIDPGRRLAAGCARLYHLVRGAIQLVSRRHGAAHRGGARDRRRRGGPRSIL